MENLKTIIEKANKELNADIFSLKNGNTIWNDTDNRCEGNDIDMKEENGKFELSMTGITEVYNTIDEAVQGLIDSVEV